MAEAVGGVRFFMDRRIYDRAASKNPPSHRKGLIRRYKQTRPIMPRSFRTYTKTPLAGGHGLGAVLSKEVKDAQLLVENAHSTTGLCTFEGGMNIMMVEGGG